jgi:hypothetical protein
MYMIAVGSGGGAIRNSVTYAGGTTYTGWTTLNTGIATNLNSVWCNYQQQTRNNIGGRWIAVGDGGVIIVSDNSGGTWTPVTSPTLNNLRGVCSIYQGGGVYYWAAVGDNGTVLWSKDNGDTWTVATVPVGSDGLARNLYSVAVDSPINGGFFVMVGAGVIYRVYAGSPTGNPTKIYDSGAAVTSSLSRLAFFGSNSNISNVTVGNANQQINNQVVSGTYIDTSYTAGTSTTYWLIVGNMAGANVVVSNPSISLTENKR